MLNETGEVLLPAAIALLDQAFELETLFNAEHAAPLRLAASLTIGEYVLPALLAQWKLVHPNSRVRMLIGNTSEVIASVVGHDADVGFIEGSQTHPDLRVLSWMSDELVIVASPRHALAGRVAGVRQLGAATWILREIGSGTRQATDSWLLDHLGTLNVEFELDSTESIKQLAMAGAGRPACPATRLRPRWSRAAWWRSRPGCRWRAGAWPSLSGAANAWGVRRRTS